MDDLKKVFAVGEIVQSDICGPTSVHSLGGSLFYVSFKDDFSEFAVIKPKQKKSDVAQEFKSFEAWAEQKSNCMIAQLRSDQGGEYVALKGYLKQKGIECTPSSSYAQIENGVAKRTNWTILECA
ncbi:Retrovirus-related Pol polyprotein from transposon TNT 1-94 [Gracilariopsis chorda]|uniref:Retrovirus-related Pol polyprotein from transposon TNT 1-94 n=1 Tax=Gracilariopsis chorda TaxID=448386 RepID=A0A2V3IXY6_9FLOR|nr:Retrovirus-related Pol polyprotein from transposon TNT 1-94 [Gracilariopsis chorda]|eukprot:PXF47016.1 Retrovirus-related Pol polyprotein from transposon TNT 1-94 [Gracilariopsis chorda]